jgi:FkbM family methyltransferase
MKFFKMLIKKCIYQYYGLMPEIKIPYETVNPGEQAWYFKKGSLTQNSIVYSFGLADNIDFDINIIKSYNVNVFGFDPTPSSIKFISSLEIPKQFYHFPLAIADYDGELDFIIPRDSNISGFSKNLHKNSQDEFTEIKVSCCSLSSIMNKLGHDKIDLLKMDIEGMEYKVIDQLVMEHFDIQQILVEFHHRFSGIGLHKTLLAVRKLRSSGFKLFHVSPWCEEYAFIKE